MAPKSRSERDGGEAQQRERSYVAGHHVDKRLRIRSIMGDLHNSVTKWSAGSNNMQQREVSRSLQARPSDPLAPQPQAQSYSSIRSLMSDLEKSVAKKSAESIKVSYPSSDPNAPGTSRPSFTLGRSSMSARARNQASLLSSIPPPLSEPASASNAGARYETSLEASTGTCFSKLVSEVKSMEEMIRDHLSFCKSSDFCDFVSSSGLSEPCFKPNPTQLNAARAKFASAWPQLPSSSSLAIVFHGTSSPNIPNILANGLDPQRRSGQAFGPGEYFGKNPGLSVGYCRHGKEMLVFLVVVPPFPRCSQDMVVVEMNQHQLPLGTVTFKEVDSNVLYESNARKRQLAWLSKLAISKAKEANALSIKAEIIQLLIGNTVDIASEKYQKHTDELDVESKKEIAMYAHRLLDADVIPFYFPELPEPMMAAERDTAEIRSVDEAVRDASTAKAKLDAERKKQGVQF